MPIQENQLGDSGLAALASNRAGYMNLPTSSIDLGAPQMGTALGQIKAQQQQFEQKTATQAQAAQMAQVKQQGLNQLANTGLQGQNASGLQQAGQVFQGQQNDQNRALQQQQIAQTGQFQQGQLQNDQVRNQLQQQQIGQSGQYQNAQIQNAQQQLQLQQQKQQQDTMIQDLGARMQLKKSDIDQRGAAASTLLMGANVYANDPQKQQQFYSTMIPQLVQNGTMSQQEADHLSQLPPDQIHTLLAADVMMSGFAKDGKAAGSILPPAANIYGNQPLSQKGQSDNQAQQTEAQRSQLDVTKSLTGFDPSFYTAAGQAQGLYGQVAGKLPQSVQSILPGVDAAKEQAAKIDANNSNILQGVMDTLAQQKGVRFNKMTVDVLKPEMPLESDSPEQAFSKLVTLNQRMQRAGTFADNLAKQGVSADSPTYQSKINDFVQSDQTPGKMTYTGSNGKQMDMGLPQIQALADHNKMSVGDTIKYVLQHP